MDTMEDIKKSEPTRIGTKVVITPARLQHELDLPFPIEHIEMDREHNVVVIYLGGGVSCRCWSMFGGTAHS